MYRFVLSALSAAFLLAGVAPAQQTSTQLLDTLRVKVRPDRIREYEAGVKRLVEANRKGGDRWVAYSTDYGDSGTIYFASLREKMADIETGIGNFEKAGKEAFGPNFAKFMADLSAMTESTTAEIRRRRWDLSINVPESREDRMKAVGAARWIRSLRIDLKPGRTGDFVAAWGPWQKELASLGPDVSAWVSMTTTGTPAMTLSVYHKNMAEMDAGDAVLPKALASEAYREFSRKTADLIVKSTWEIHRIRPELSCAPDELAALDPEFWRPKSATVATRMKKDAAAPKK